MSKIRGKRLIPLLLTVCILLCAAVLPSGTAAQTPETGKYITTEYLRLRSVPTTENNTSLLTIPLDAEITVTEVVKGTDGLFWGKTVYDNVPGYVCMDYCKKIGVQQPPAPGEYGTGLYKTKLNINMRKDASTSSGRVCIVPAGKILNVTATAVDEHGYVWGKASYNSNNGTFNAYVRLDNCEKYVLPKLPAATGPDSIYSQIIDISQWQTEDNIDWSAVKAGGTDGVIIRIGGRGWGDAKSLYTDEAFYNHYINARAAGLHVGCYYFSYALNREDAQEEARATLSLISQYDCVFDLPVFIDIEEGDGRYDHYYAGKAACTEVADAYCEVIEQAGYYAGIYCNLDFANNLIDSSAFKGRGAWIAQYNTSCTFEGRVDMWQYTKTGIIPGYNGRLDVNVCYVNYPVLIAGGRTPDESTSGRPETTTRKPEPTTVKPPEPTTQPPEPTTEKPIVPVITPGSEWVVTTPPACAKDGVMTLYENGTAVHESVIRQSHANKTECVLINTKIKVSAGDIIDTELFAANFFTSDSPYFRSRLEEVQKQGGCYCVYCLDCGEIIEVRNYMASRNCIHSYESKQIAAPGCVNEGKVTETCIECGFTGKEYIVERTEHTPGASVMTWQTDKPCTTVSCTACRTVMEKQYLAKGDIDTDGSVTVLDARTVLRVCIGLDLTQAHYMKLANMDGDNALTVGDARLILRKAIGLDK